MPIELLHQIFRDAWALYPVGDAKQGWGERWEFYNNVSLTCRGWSAVMAAVALRRITIQCSRDFAFYRRLIIRVLGADPDCKDGDSERVHPAARAYFTSSTVHIVLTDIDCNGASGPGYMWRTDYARIPLYVPNCRFIEVITKELPTDHRYYTLPYHPLFEFLKQYDRTPRVDLAWTYEHNKRYVRPTQLISGVTHLRLHYVPRCVCHKIQTSPMGMGPNGTLIPLVLPPPAHIADCFSYYLPTLFPDLRHLHIDTPYLLKNLATPRSLLVLTIEAPPIHFLKEEGGYYSSLAAWNILSALSAGLLQRTEGHTLVVNAGPKEPSNWQRTWAKCKKHGVDLELRSVYELPHDKSRELLA